MLTVIGYNEATYKHYYSDIIVSLRCYGGAVSVW